MAAEVTHDDWWMKGPKVLVPDELTRNTAATMRFIQDQLETVMESVTDPDAAEKFLRVYDEVERIRQSMLLARGLDAQRIWASAKKIPTQL